MKERLKNKMTPVLGLLTVIFLVFSLSFFKNASKQKELLDQERQTRMELEETVFNVTNQNTHLEQELTKLQEDRDSLQATCLTLKQEISDLKKELQKLAR